jgi:regulator of sigma E protease
VTSALAFLFVLGVLIFVHELGHFLMARRIGVRVLTFSLGFGPKLINVKRGDTEYCISAIPLGGYVKMAGENPEDQRTGASDEFLSKGKWQRFQVLVMGPVMNLLLALVVMAVVLFQGAQLPAYEQQAVVIGSFADKSVGAQAGLKVGDRIATVDGKPVDNWDEFGTVIISKAKRDVSLGIVRAGKPLQISVVPSAQGKYELGDIGVLPVVHPQIEEIVPGQAAEAAGLQRRHGRRRRQRHHLRRPAQDDSREREQAARFPHQARRRPDGAHRHAAAPGRGRQDRRDDPAARDANRGSRRARSGEAQLREELRVDEDDLPDAWRVVHPRDVAIADLSGTAAHAGWIPLFSLMAMISLNLGLLNLMPIPVLDGGHIFILALEGLARRDFSMKVKEKMLLGGFVLLLMLMVTVIYNDLMRIQWIEKLVPWR